MKKATKAVWNGEQASFLKGATQPPIVNSVVFAYDDIQTWENVISGAEDGYVYGRYNNPTVEVFEEKVRDLENAEAAISFSTGMAAITDTFFTLLKAGDKVVSIKDTYGGTNKLFNDFLPNFEIDVVLCETDDRALKAEIKKGCTLLYLETPTNPTLKINDIAHLTEIAHEVGAIVMVDNTLATPINQTPITLEADLVVHSATKYLGGHSDAMGGVLCGKKELIEKVYNYHTVTGASLDPAVAYSLLRGMKTLQLRIERQNESALQIAKFPKQHPLVEHVFYPGLADHSQHDIAKKQMNGFGGMLSFSLHGGMETVRTVLPKLTHAHLAAHLGGLETTVGPIHTTSHAECTLEEQLAMGLPEGLVRYSTGIEAVDDLISDLEQAFAAKKIMS